MESSPGQAEATFSGIEAEFYGNDVVHLTLLRGAAAGGDG